MDKLEEFYLELKRQLQLSVSTYKYKNGLYGKISLKDINDLYVNSFDFKTTRPHNHYKDKEYMFHVEYGIDKTFNLQNCLCNCIDCFDYFPIVDSKINNKRYVALDNHYLIPSELISSISKGYHYGNEYIHTVLFLNLDNFNITFTNNILGQNLVLFNLRKLLKNFKIDVSDTSFLRQYFANGTFTNNRLCDLISKLILSKRDNRYRESLLKIFDDDRYVGDRLTLTEYIETFIDFATHNVVEVLYQLIGAIDKYQIWNAFRNDYKVLPIVLASDKAKTYPAQKLYIGYSIYNYLGKGKEYLESLKHPRKKSGIKAFIPDNNIYKHSMIKECMTFIYNIKLLDYETIRNIEIKEDDRSIIEDPLIDHTKINFEEEL